MRESFNRGKEGEERQRGRVRERERGKEKEREQDRNLLRRRGNLVEYLGF